MHPSDYVLGIDAGGTSTRCWAVSLDGRLLGYGQTGPGNLYSVGLAHLVEKASIAVKAALGGEQSAPAQVLYVGAAGVGRPVEQDQVRTALTQTALAHKVFVENDAFIALAAGTLGGPGIAVISGTGSMAIGLAPDGRRGRAGGWGYLLGDEGSGFAIGQQGLVAVLRAFDGRGSATALSSTLLDALNLAHPPDLVELVYAHPDRQRLATLAPVVVQTALQGDEVAQGILRSAADELALAATAVYNGLSLPADAPVVFTGGVFRAEEMVRLFQLSLSARLPQVTQVRLPWEPALGAVFLGLRTAGVKLTPDKATALATTWQQRAKKGDAKFA